MHTCLALSVYISALILTFIGISGTYKNEQKIHGKSDGLHKKNAKILQKVDVYYVTFFTYGPFLRYVIIKKTMGGYNHRGVRIIMTR